MVLIFKWDTDKAASNLDKHGVSFKEDLTVFGDPLALMISDPLHLSDEDRFVPIGVAATFRGRALVVVHTERGNRIRIISAHVATRSERRRYERGDDAD